MTEIDAQQELAFIKKVMNDSRKILIDDGKGFIFWGILVTIGLLVTYLSVAGKWTVSLVWFWPALVAIGWIYTIVTEIRREKRSKTSTFAGKVLGGLWLAVGISATILGFAGSISGAYHGVFISPLISIVLGIGYFLSGILYGKSWLSLLSIGWWVGAIVMFFMQNLEVILVMIGMMIILQIIPGIILFKVFKSEKRATE